MVVLKPTEEGGYTVSIPSLPGCVSEGDTEDALLDIREAKSFTWNRWMMIGSREKEFWYKSSYCEPESSQPPLREDHSHAATGWTSNLSGWTSRRRTRCRGQGGKRCA